MSNGRALFPIFLRKACLYHKTFAQNMNVFEKSSITENTEPIFADISS